VGLVLISDAATMGEPTTATTLVVTSGVAASLHHLKAYLYLKICCLLFFKIFFI